jgi:signal transduction histidine kinase
MEHLYKIASLIRQERSYLMAEWRHEVRKLPIAKDLDEFVLNDHIPALLEELAHEFERSSDETMIEGLEKEPAIHGLIRLQLRFDVEEVIAEYNALRGVLQKFIEEYNLNQKGTLHHTLNRVIDRSIGIAVKTYSEQKALEIQKHREEHLSFVTHDLRAPLVTIGLAARIFEKHISNNKNDKEQTDKFLNHLYNNIDLLDDLIKKVIQEEYNLTETTRERLLQQKEINLHDFVDHIIMNFHPLIEASNIHLTNSIPEEIKIVADARLLSSIFQNLISNAIKYTSKGEISVGAKKVVGFIECWIKDNGTGIAKDRLDKIFDKLETDPQRKDGMGLGLTIVKKFVEAHGGTVTVDSKLGSGSTFRFTLSVN